MNLKRSTGSNIFKIEYTEQYIEEITQVYEYICKELKESNSARRLIDKINVRVLRLEQNPQMHMKIGKTDRLKREYRRLLVENYIILYTIDYSHKKVFVSSIFYSRKNYLR